MATAMLHHSIKTWIWSETSKYMVRVTPKTVTALKAVIHLLNLSFLFVWYYWAFTDNLGADPVKTIIHFTGMGALNLLLLTLLVSPLARFLKQPQLIKIRRVLGLYSFSWALLHLSNYLVFDLQLAISTFVEDIIKRPYITVGICAFLILLALAITSPRAMQRKLGKHWLKLHKLIYPASLLIALHFIWSVKSLDPEPLIYWLLLLLLLSTRLKSVQTVLFRKTVKK